MLHTLFLLGLVAEGMTGALAAGRRRMDLFGVVIIASATAMASVALVAGIAAELALSRAVAHPLRQLRRSVDAIAHGNRLIMMYDGRIVVDVSGEEKQRLTVEDLLALFEKASGQALASDRMLLG